MDYCKVCENNKKGLMKARENIFICESCLILVAQQYFPYLEIKNNPFIQNNFICVSCFEKAEVLFIDEGCPEEYCGRCSSGLNSNQLLDLSRVDIKRYKKARVSKEKLEFVMNRLEDFNQVYLEILQNIETSRERLKNTYEQSLKRLESEFNSAIQKIETFKENVQKIVDNLKNQAKVSVLKKAFADRTEGENIVFSKSNRDFFKEKLSLNLTFNFENISEKIGSIFSIADFDYFSFFPATLKCFVSSSNKFITFTPDLLSKVSRNFAQEIRFSRGSWIETPYSQVFQNNVNYAGTTGLALITHSNEVSIIEKIDYRNEMGCLAYADYQVFFISKEVSFKLNLKTNERVNIQKSPSYMKEGSSTSLDNKIICLSQDRTDLFVYSITGNKYESRACEALKSSKKFVFTFKNKLLLISGRFLTEITDLIAGGTAYVLADNLKEFYFFITSYKIIEQHVYLLTNDRLIYRLSLPDNKLDEISLET